ncbi:ParA family protein, partial [Pantoea ananatis]|uniref:ParA family protein n=2 Tax=Erwiniaceae TaxID=1903409 RepID=UPI001B301D3C
MKTISVFNNKGGVGKTTLTYHIAHSISEMGFKVLMIDADPQCNLTIYSLKQEFIHDLWAEEDTFIDEGFEYAHNALSSKQYDKII